MLEQFNSDKKELIATNRDLQTYIDGCHKESERCAAYPEQSTAHFNNVVNITVDSDSITPQKGKNGREEDRQEYRQIPFDKNVENNSIIVSEAIEPNTSKSIEPNTRNKIEQVTSKKK